MSIVCLVVLFLTFFGLAGCDSHSEMVWDEPAQQSEPVKVEQSSPRIQPEVGVTQSEPFKGEEFVEEQGPSGIQETATVRKPQSWGRDLTMDSKLYLTKAGELFGDLTIQNRSHVSVSRITVHCVEYNMNHAPVREAMATWRKTLRPGESGYWDQANFGYVHDDFDTVNCEIVNAELS